MRDYGRIIAIYEEAKVSIIGAGYASELQWSASLGDYKLKELDFLREIAWVVLCSGFRESVVRAKFSYISLCFCDWESASAIVKNADLCIQTARLAFGHLGKLTSLVAIAEIVSETTFGEVVRRLADDPLAELMRFPFIGRVTSQHLAKNLGYPLAKDDRHLKRLAKSYAFSNAQEMCELISAHTGESVPVVDTVLWRACALGLV